MSTTFLGPLLSPPRGEMVLAGSPGHRNDDPPERQKQTTTQGALLVLGLVRAPDDTPLEHPLTELLLPHYRKRLARAVRRGDTLYRVGSTRIGVVCLGVSNWSQLSELLARLHRAVGPAVPLPGAEGYAAVSMTAVLSDDALQRLRSLHQSVTE
ncbi:hypothetical protein [Kineosporia sp. NBRC 101731]|uniref:hypothetical protein n=1 Tax=Kineosporia sp. NBRC 101731 TaxID=3032199 RepID=UPI0024A07B48|nr:hypothetical protein [Kineosporia sp. NBRC 101731]GLY33234.1 hypothetical protein Kisp02_65990 [Kineosporia sp. NBRC 101731]